MWESFTFYVLNLSSGNHLNETHEKNLLSNTIFPLVLCLFPSLWDFLKKKKKRVFSAKFPFASQFICYLGYNQICILNPLSFLLIKVLFTFAREIKVFNYNPNATHAREWKEELCLVVEWGKHGRWRLNRPGNESSSVTPLTHLPILSFIHSLTCAFERCWLSTCGPGWAKRQGRE